MSFRMCSRTLRQGIRDYTAAEGGAWPAAFAEQEWGRRLH